jgi:hypothetical protein
VELVDVELVVVGCSVLVELEDDVEVVDVEVEVVDDVDVELVVGTGDVVLVEEVLVDELELVDDEVLDEEDVLVEDDVLVEELVDEDVLVDDDVLLLVDEVVDAGVVVLVDEDVELEVVDDVEVVVPPCPGRPVQAPFSQWSAMVHAFASSQGAWLSTCWQNRKSPVQTSSVHGLPSSKHGAPGVGVPEQTPPLHVSFVVHSLKSVH